MSAYRTVRAAYTGNLRLLAGEGDARRCVEFDHRLTTIVATVESWDPEKRDGRGWWRIDFRRSFRAPRVNEPDFEYRATARDLLAEGR